MSYITYHRSLTSDPPLLLPTSHQPVDGSDNLASIGYDFWADDSPFLPSELCKFHNAPLLHPEGVQLYAPESSVDLPYTGIDRTMVSTHAVDPFLEGSTYRHNVLIAPESLYLDPAESLNSEGGHRTITAERIVADTCDSEYVEEEEEEEYVSVTRRAKKRRPSHPADQSLTTNTITSKKRARLISAPRNVQISDTSLDFVRKSHPYACPARECTWIQRNRRMPDLRRHIATHTRCAKLQEWVCHGVPTEDGCRPNVTYFYQGMEMHGGCMKTFARRDALLRHLSNANTGCLS